MNREAILQNCVEKAAIVQELQKSLLTSVNSLQRNYEDASFGPAFISLLAKRSMQITEGLPMYIECLLELTERQVESEESVPDILEKLCKLRTFNSKLWDLYKFHIQRAETLVALPHLCNKPVTFDVHQVDLTLKAYHDQVQYYYETFVKPLTFTHHSLLLELDSNGLK